MKALNKNSNINIVPKMNMADSNFISEFVPLQLKYSLWNYQFCWKPSGKIKFVENCQKVVMLELKTLT